MDRRRWNKLIKVEMMIKIGEWVNVSSGTSSPEQSRTKGCKTVVVVVLVVVIENDPTNACRYLLGIFLQHIMIIIARYTCK